MNNHVSPHWYYAESASQFIKDARNGEFLTDQLCEAHEFFYENSTPANGEVESWKRSPLALANLLESAGLTGDQAVILEVFTNINSRVDAIICGEDKNRVSTAFLLELKQWTPDRSELRVSDSKEKIIKIHKRFVDEVDHPGTKINRLAYEMHKACIDTLINDHSMQIAAGIYLHNCDTYPDKWSDVLSDVRYGNWSKMVSVYTHAEDQQLKIDLAELVGHGSGIPAIQKLTEMMKPKKKLAKRFVMYTDEDPENDL